jgi:hypothetical protein
VIELFSHVSDSVGEGLPAAGVLSGTELVGRGVASDRAVRDGHPVPDVRAGALVGFFAPSWGATRGVAPT